MRNLLSTVAATAKHAAVGMLVLHFCGADARAGLKEGKAALEAGDYLTAEDEFRPLAERGDPEAQLNLGLMYEMGWGPARNLDAAAAWYRKAAEQGNHFAQDSLGSLLSRSEQYEEAMQWFLKAAEQGNASAQNNLGYMHSQGRGVPRDPVRAYMWYAIAAETEPEGYGAKARRNMDIVGKTLSAGQKSEALRLAHEWMDRRKR